MKQGVWALIVIMAIGFGGFSYYRFYQSRSDSVSYETFSSPTHGLSIKRPKGWVSSSKDRSQLYVLYDANKTRSVSLTAFKKLSNAPVSKTVAAALKARFSKFGWTVTSDGMETLGSTPVAWYKAKKVNRNKVEVHMLSKLIASKHWFVRFDCASNKQVFGTWEKACQTMFASLTFGDAQLKSPQPPKTQPKPTPPTSKPH